MSYSICIRCRGMCNGCMRCYDEREEECDDEEYLLEDEEFDVDEE